MIYNDPLQGDDHPADDKTGSKSASHKEHPVGKVTCNPRNEQPVRQVKISETMKMDHPVGGGYEGLVHTPDQHSAKQQPSHTDVRDAGQAGGVSQDGHEQLRVANFVPTLPSKTKVSQEGEKKFKKDHRV